jgi:hypothetical protein
MLQQCFVKCFVDHEKIILAGPKRRRRTRRPGSAGDLRAVVVGAVYWSRVALALPGGGLDSAGIDFRGTLRRVDAINSATIIAISATD